MLNIHDEREENTIGKYPKWVPIKRMYSRNGEYKKA